MEDIHLAKVLRWGLLLYHQLVTKLKPTRKPHSHWNCHQKHTKSHKHSNDFQAWNWLTSRPLGMMSLSLPGASKHPWGKSMFFLDCCGNKTNEKGSKRCVQLQIIHSFHIYGADEPPLCSWEVTTIASKCTGLLLKTPRLLCYSWSISGQIANSTEGLESNLSV